LRFNLEYERVEQELISETEMRDDAEDTELNMKELINYASYFMTHLEDLFLAPDNPKQQAVLFSLIFNQIPTYNDLVNRTLNLAPIFKLNQQFALTKSFCVICYEQIRTDFQTTRNHSLTASRFA